MSFSFFSSIIIIYIIILVAIAFFTLLERKALGYFHIRKGPNKVGLIGLPQPFADAIKLFLKELSKPSTSNSLTFILSPIIRILLALILWSLYPHPYPPYFIIYSILIFLALSRLNVYTLLGAGWSSNSKYSLLGALRSVAQTISYEVSITLILLSSLLIMKSFNIQFISINQWTPQAIIIFIIFILWNITTLAETNRTPFDHAEGESELVSGFNTEFRSGTFALIFIAEYTNILIIGLLTAVLFFNSIPNQFIRIIWIVTKTRFFAFFFIWARATLPRIRYDKLINLTWKIFLPITLTFLITILIPASIIYLISLTKTLNCDFKFGLPIRSCYVILL